MLIWAAEKGRADCVRLLLDAGADKNAQTKVRASRFCGRAVLPVVVDVATRVYYLTKQAICISVFIFSFSNFFCVLLRAPNRVAATESME